MLDVHTIALLLLPLLLLWENLDRDVGKRTSLGIASLAADWLSLITAGDLGRPTALLLCDSAGSTSLTNTYNNKHINSSNYVRISHSVKFWGTARGPTVLKHCEGEQ